MLLENFANINFASCGTFKAQKLNLTYSYTTIKEQTISWTHIFLVLSCKEGFVIMLGVYTHAHMEACMRQHSHANPAYGAEY